MWFFFGSDNIVSRSVNVIARVKRGAKNMKGRKKVDKNGEINSYGS